ncbi:MAG: patatin family protein [Ruminococcus sp.]|nr:patatin family protein [Ruminococcus sp.]
MTGLVLEGGTFRGIFSAGFMDGLIECGITFPYIVGVSAGISNAASYVSGQFGRNIEILKKYRGDKRYMGVKNFASCKSYFGLDFVYDEIPNSLVPFDYDTYHSYKGRFLVGVTNAETGKLECMDGMTDTDKWTYLRASCAIPGYFPAIEINGKYYYDGGLSSPICVKQAIKDGCDRTVLILTQPAGFVKKCGKGNMVMSQVIRKRFPALEMPLLARHRVYNDQLAFCGELEKRGKTLIFRPEYQLNSFEKNTDILEQYWKMGYDMCIANREKILAFMD